MKKVLLTIGIIVLILGIGCLIGGFAMNDWKGIELDYVEKAYASEHVEYTDITLNIEMANMVVTYGDALSLRYSESDYSHFEIKDEGDGKLVVEEKYDNKMFRWFRLFYLANKLPVLELTLPQLDVAPNLNINSAVGEVKLSGDFKTLNIENKNGSVDYQNGAVGEAHIQSTNGIITLQTIDAMEDSGKIYASTTNGVVKVNDVNTKLGIEVRTTNGKVELANCTTEGALVATTTNGTVSVDRIAFKTARLKTTNGSIFGSILGVQSQFNINCDTTNGEVSPSDQSPSGALYTLNADTTNGDITLSFVS